MIFFLIVSYWVLLNANKSAKYKQHTSGSGGLYNSASKTLVKVNMENKVASR